MKGFAWAAAVFTLAFAVLLGLRLGIWQQLSAPAPVGRPSLPPGVAETDIWMNLFLKERKIGYTRSVLERRAGGYRLRESLFMRINQMGLSQDVRMHTAADLDADLSLERFEFSLDSGLMGLSATGRLNPGNVLTIETDLSGTPQATDVQLAGPLYLTGAMIRAAAAEFWTAQTKRFSFDLFDPATMSQAPVTVRVVGQEQIQVLGRSTAVARLALSYRGAEQTVWVDRQGEIVREEGLLGMRLEKTTRELATRLDGLPPAEDITRIASAPVKGKIDTPRRATFLRVALSGIDALGLALDGGRQSFTGDILTIRQETLPAGNARHPLAAPKELAPYLTPEPFIESDHPTITARADTIVGADASPVEAAQALVTWVFENIQKHPVISVPDAVTTLDNRVGDCNEHAVLLAALARAAGIPAAIESGLVFLNGRFYYHAWNTLYLGRWVTADAVFGQMPTDATHLRLAEGGPHAALDLMAVMGRIGITVEEYRISNKE